jgi:hypothetical protein
MASSQGKLEEGRKGKGEKELRVDACGFGVLGSEGKR